MYRLAFLFFLIMNVAVSLPAQNYDAAMKSAGMVDIAEIVPDVVIDLMYAGKDNFVGEDMYGTLKKAYIHPEAAAGLAKAQTALRKEYPGYSLKVCDAARPISVQRKMWNKVKGTPKSKYVSNPTRGGGQHNFGLAVDITIIDENGNELPMGTPVDHLGYESNIDSETSLVKQGKISEQERQNRLLLRKVMRAGGFSALRTEWWHFNFKSRAVARSRYKLLDF
ncbi:MAG: M15 family metallopeptidase [Paramuribaculum sp.]|nr:M15 family metallopeptidase [Paramuribaculum sp.]MDE6459228.1 M15 family metallopeptidase [Paramuribaculum sp.]MDE6652392.1 M15 family metallopeptidase [Paramuribaculum sp.]